MARRRHRSPSRRRRRRRGRPLRRRRGRRARRRRRPTAHGACASVIDRPGGDAPRPDATGGRWRCTGRCRARSRHAPGRASPVRRRRRGRGRPAHLQRRPRSRHAGRRSQRRVRRVASPCSAASCSTSAGWTASSDVDDDIAARRRPRRAPSATSSRTTLRAEHDAHRRALAAVDGAVDRRRLGRLPGAGQYSTRYGKIEDMVVGLEVVLADGTRRAHRWSRARARGRSRSQRSCSSAARARSA